MRKTFVLWLLAIFLLTATVSGGLIYAQDGDEAVEQPGKEEQAAKVLEEVKDRLRNKASTLTDVVKDISLIEEKLADAKEEVQTLEEQLASIDEEVELTEKEINLTETELLILEEDIELTREQILEKKEEIEEVKLLLADFVRFVHVQNIETGSFDSSVSQTIKLLFAKDQASEQLSELHFLELMEITTRSLFEELDRIREELELERLRLEAEQELMVIRQNDLERQRKVLEVKRNAKADLLEETKGKEEIFQTLLLQAKQEQATIRLDIKSLSESYGRLSQQIEYEQEQRGTSNDGPKIGSKLFDAKLVWPVPPTRGISATFRDSSYKAALGVEHNAVDIRAVMQTPIKAAADGVVYRVKGGEGLDYHYTIIAHQDGIMTLYGHMYDITVTEGQYVSAGQTIGLSGAMPGTRGAGYLTTGPHLHFEVFENGKHVDPMYYLDLSGIEEKYVPSAYKHLIPGA